MKAVSGRELVRVVQGHGWQLLPVHGSHHIYGKAGSIVRLSIPVHGNEPLKTALVKHPLKMAGLDERALD